MNGQTISLAVAALIGSPVVTTFLIRKFGKAAPAVEQVIETIASDTLHVVEDLATTPWFAGVAATTKLTAHHVIGKLEDSELALASMKGVGAFNAALKVGLADMTATQKTDLMELVKSELARVSVKVTDAQVVQALKVAQVGLEFVGTHVIPTVQAHDAAVQAWNQPVEAQQPSA